MQRHAANYDARPALSAQVVVAALGIALFHGVAAPRAAAAEPSLATAREVRQLLSNRCYACHGPDEAARQASLRLDQQQGAWVELDSGKRAVVPGKPGESVLLERVASGDDDLRMPPPEAGGRLTDDEIQVLTEWIEQGASFVEHWAYEKPVRPELPTVSDASWPQNEIDYFILSRLEAEGLKPSPPADRRTLLRRLSLDLTGLPPTPADVEAFVADVEPGAVGRVVDRLLASPAYGEHWARQWLDLARYADSAGYADDPPRTIWMYRDWVIRAINANMPYDQFTVEQLAGDLLPNPTDDQLIATALHRNTMTNSEGGTVDEEFRNAAVVDRVNTTMEVWMGTTMACAQCHDHKYDPISQKDYFRLFAIFNNSADADQRDEQPLLEHWTEEQLARKAQWADQLAVERYYLALAPESEHLAARIAEIEKQISEAKPHATTPIMRELPPEKRRTTYVQRRGNYLDLGEEVHAGLPDAFHPPGSDGAVDRLKLARWLVSAENPLTARVLANRTWEAIFGVGLVRTSEDFGVQGDRPSHPELLDWLATEVVRQGWDAKALVRLLATSAAYRQSSAATPDAYAEDPDNRFLARGPRFRLTAEAIRDQALFVAGLLSRSMYGPPVRPPQPKLGLNAAFGSGVDWEASAGEDRYRRGLYTTWRRSSPYPSMAAFDAPNREVCKVRRTRTNTPLQALVTLNDPVYVEAAQGLARRMAAAPGTPRDRVRYGVQLCLARDPDEAEATRLAELYEEVRRRMSAAPAAAMQLATDPLGPLPEGADAAELAAWTVVGNVLLNLDEMFLKP